MWQRLALLAASGGRAAIAAGGTTHHWRVPLICFTVAQRCHQLGVTTVRYEPAKLQDALAGWVSRWVL